MNRRTFILGSCASLVALHLAEAKAAVMSDDEILKILKRRVETERRSVGMAVCIVTPVQKRFVAFGRERVGDERPITPETVFEIGSITKVFTALLLADMSRRGEVGLNDPVARHLPADFHLPELNGRAITLIDLATHTSGLPRFPTFAGPLFSPAWLQSLAQYSVQDLKAWLRDFHPTRAAGAEWEYSNAGYGLLGLALAHRGGRPYDELLQTRVLGPLGLHDTTFHPTAAMQSRRAECHDAALKPIPPIELGIFAPAGGLLSTPSDLSRFATAILAGSDADLALDNQILLKTRRDAPWIGGKQALGWEVLGTQGNEFVSKDGVTWGNAASMVYDPQSRSAVAAFSNTVPDLRSTSPSGGGIGAADIARHLLRSEIPLG